MVAIWLAILAFPALLSSSQFTDHPNTNTSASFAELATVPEATKKVLGDWFRKKAYSYLIMTVPDLEVVTGGKDKNYADFAKHLQQCAGVCIGGFDFEWEIARGQGSVETSEPAMFTWAPDERPQGMKMMAFMKLKMQMPTLIEEVKKALDNWNGAFIQCNSEADLHPDWVVPKLRGGRMGGRRDKLNAEGKALWDKLAAELEIGSSGDFEPVHVEEPVEPVEPLRPTTGGTGGHGSGGTGGHGSIPSTSKEAIQSMISEMVSKIMTSKRSDILEAAKSSAMMVHASGIHDVAKKAAQAAVKDIFKDAK